MNKSQILFFTKIKFFLCLATFTTLLFSSCKHDDEKASWQTEIVTPLFKSSLSINDIISDTLLQTNSDSSLTVVYENHLYNMTIDSLFSLYDTSVTKNYKLDSISLYNTNISYSVSLGQICLTAGPPLSTFIFQFLNTTTVIPIGFPLPADTLNLNADTLFTTMTLISGFIDISIHNGFPVDINNVNYTLKNTINGSVIGSGIFPIIAANTTQTQTIDLAGKTVEGDMTAIISGVNTSPSAGPVLIDTTNVIIASLNIHDLHPSTATALFPTQNLINKSQPFTFDSAITVQLKEAKVKSGQIVMDLYSTLQDSVHFTYSLPSATLNGVAFEVTKILPPAPAGGPASHFNQAYDFSDYVLDMSGENHDTINTMFNVFIARVDSTGQMRTLSLTDSMYANIGFVGLIPFYGRGYLGQQSFNIGPSQLNIDVFKNLSGNLDLEDVKLSIVAENGIGAEARVTIGNLSSFNSRTNNTVNLSGSAISNPINILRATETGIPAQPVNIVNTVFQMDNTNSNAPAFISNFPDKINYSLSLETNPNGNNNYTDFIYADYLMEFNLDVEMPLSFKANDLTLSSTAEFSLNQTDISRIKDGTLTLIADNGFPFEANIKLYLLDLSGNISDSTFFPNIVIAAAPVDANNKVKEKKRSKTDIQLSEQKINTLFTIQKMKVVAKFNTFPANSFLKIYSDYKIDFQMTGDFNYLAN